MKYKLSPTTLGLFRECPRCFWLRFNKSIKRPNGIFPSLPSGMDCSIKAYMDVCRKANKIPEELSESGAGLFPDQRLLEVWRNPFKGLQWKDENGNIFMGAIDDALTKENNIIVLDYKTRGSAPTASTATYYQLQLDSYNFLLNSNAHTTANYAYLLFYFPDYIEDNCLCHFQSCLVRVYVDPLNALKTFKEAIACLESNIPEQSCDYCRHIPAGG